jgi:hypothetical protein
MGRAGGGNRRVAGVRRDGAVLTKEERRAGPEKIVYLHVDLDAPAAEIACLEAAVRSHGGAVVFDDYGWIVFRQQKIAEDASSRRAAIPSWSFRQARASSSRA